MAWRMYPEDWKGGYATPVEAVKALPVRAAEAKTAKDRVDEAGEKTGLFTGLYADQPDHRREAAAVHRRLTC